MLFVAFPLALVGLTATLGTGSPFRWFYQPIVEPRAEAFVKEALREASAWIGPPKKPVRLVQIRLSQPRDAKSKLRRGFQLCETVDAERGIYCIYLSRKPGEYAFHGQLAHEVFHLLRPRAMDAYIEGLATVFAERFLRQKKLDWDGWDRHFQAGADPFYAATYRMMKEVATLAGDAHLRGLFEHLRPAEKEGQERLDIETWLQTLPEMLRKQVRAVILKHAPVVREALRQARLDLTFTMPR